ncbi:unnamed protein product [Adineta ricciae]|uniref:Uncharacterized protein n=1 Tax=Adineta ricciae TaxID=249248 RepID=A0A814YPG9_ADIRI|nr:unnamed protein product [Adineta ricciae]CAF1233757.1 unnamed protein product [Adineta ricciae]
MPKVRRKRRSTTPKTNPLSRPKKTLAKEIPTQERPTKPVYFDITADPTNSIKSKSTGNFIKIGKPPRNLKIPNSWDVKPGDVISWSEGRPTETFFVTSEGTLLKNPDTSGSGYLTFPLSITSQFSDVLDSYSTVLDAVGRNNVSSIELLPTDAFFAAHFAKQPLPASIRNRTDIKYSFEPNDEILFVTLPNSPDECREFALNSAKLDDIIQYISNENESKGQLVVKFNFEGKPTCSKAPRGIVSGLPTGWQCQQQGSLMFGETKIQGEWICQGPDKSKDKARKAIEKFYKGLNVEIK